ncbi:hypothetical protein ABW20_dc0100109 [Dactylellina cionopaga]|nr:hypothetical protein ABW20_dc0100109 [Dactylellina cionopaga]
MLFALVNASPTSKNTKRGVAEDSFVKLFDNWTGSTQTGGYLTFKTLPSRDVELCAAKCIANARCVFFNLYDETNPAGLLHKCALYSTPSTKAQAVNYGGQNHGSVNTKSVKSLSVAYKKKSLQAIVSGYSFQCFGDAAISAPNNGTTYMGVSFTTTSPASCAAACDAKTASNLNAAAPGSTYRVCNFFDFYNIYEDGVLYQTACTLFTMPYDASFATNYGSIKNGYSYTIGESCAYTKNMLVGIGGVATKPSAP